MRAAFLAVMAGKQVAVLVPTTILAQQHLETFRKRFAGYPVSVEMLSRFRTTAENARRWRGIASGRLDVVIGTHRLLQKDVQVPRARPAGGRRGASLRREGQGAHQRAARRRRRADAHRDADPAHAQDGALGHPRSLRHRDAAGRPARHPHLRHALRRGGDPRRDPARARPRRAGVLRAQPGRDHRRHGRAGWARSCPRRSIAVAHGQMAEGAAREERCSPSCTARPTCW